MEPMWNQAGTKGRMLPNANKYYSFLENNQCGENIGTKWNQVGTKAEPSQISTSLTRNTRFCLILAPAPSPFIILKKSWGGPFARALPQDFFSIIRGCGGNRNSSGRTT